MILFTTTFMQYILFLNNIHQQFYTMKRPQPFANKILKRIEDQKFLDAHQDRLKKVRPNTTAYDLEDIKLNKGKRDMILEDKYTEIERQNRLLLQKITSTMSKRIDYKQKQFMNRSLNSNFRKKQIRNIEIQNAKLLKRLQEKKSDYDTCKMKQEWLKQKSISKNIANFPIIPKNRSISHHHQYRMPSQALQKNRLSSDIEMVRIRNIDGLNFVVTVKLDQVKLTIIGDLNKGKQIKLIQIPKEEAISFIEEECKGKLQNIFNRLKYDHKEEVLYLLGEGVEVEQANKEVQELKNPEHQQQMKEEQIEEQE